MVARLERHTLGRPTKFTAELADEICAHLAAGGSLLKWCSAEDHPDTATVYRWLQRRKAFRAMYVKAREAQAHTYAAQIVDLADDCAPGDEARIRLQLDARKWAAARLVPRVYGERAHLEVAGEGGGPVTFASLARAARAGRGKTAQ